MMITYLYDNIITTKIVKEHWKGGNKICLPMKAGESNGKFEKLPTPLIGAGYGVGIVNS